MYGFSQLPYMKSVYKGVVCLDGKRKNDPSIPFHILTPVKQRSGIILFSQICMRNMGICNPRYGRKLKVSCLCSQLSFIFGHPSPSTSMYFALFPYYFPCEESIREKVFFRLNRSLLLYPKVLLNFSWLPL